MAKARKKQQKTPTDTLRLENRSTAFVFASFCVFTGSLIAVVYLPLKTGDTSSVEFARAFQIVDSDLSMLWILVIHAVRMQLGILFNYMDPSYNTALKALAQQKDGPKKIDVVRLHRKNEGIWIALLILVGVLPRMLSSGSFRLVLVNLFVQCLFISYWWWNNWPVIRMDKDVRGNTMLAIGDVLFVSLILLTVLSGGIVVGEGVLKLLPQWMLNTFAWYAGFAYTSMRIILVLELPFTYGEGFVAAAKEFVSVVSSLVKKR